jgi:hypothetical protein
VLGLEDNDISSWWEVLRLAWLPRLRRLHLSGNPISHIWYPSAAPAGSSTPTGASRGAEAALPPPATAAAPQQQPAAPQQHPSSSQAASGAGSATVAAVRGPAFPALEALLLGGCQIASWADVNQLDRFPALRELRLSGNPLVAGAKSGGRFEVRGGKGRWLPARTMPRSQRHDQHAIQGPAACF